jgi:hypothetical protein
MRSELLIRETTNNTNITASAITTFGVSNCVTPKGRIMNGRIYKREKTILVTMN